MVWGGISHGVKSQLIVKMGNLTAVKNRDEVLCPVAVLVQQHQLVLQNANARPHVARVCSSYLDNLNNTPLDWPTYSPGLSPIQHLRDALQYEGDEISPARPLSSS